MLPDQGSHTMTHVPNNPAAARFAFDNTYARELEGFYVPWKAAQVARPSLVKLNHELAEELGLDTGALDYWSLNCSHVAVLVGMEVAAVLLNDPCFDSAPQKTSLAGFQQAWAANAFLAAFIRPLP